MDDSKKKEVVEDLIQQATGGAIKEDLREMLQQLLGVWELMTRIKGYYVPLVCIITDPKVQTALGVMSGIKKLPANTDNMERALKMALQIIEENRKIEGE